MNLTQLAELIKSLMASINTLTQALVTSTAASNAVVDSAHAVVSANADAVARIDMNAKQVNDDAKRIEDAINGLLGGDVTPTAEQLNLKATNL